MSDPTDPTSVAPQTILIIEDQLGEVELLRHALENHACGEFRLLHEATLEAGMARLERGGVDLILLDLGLPDSQGFESACEVLACAADVPVVVLTYRDDVALGLQIVHEGAQDYLVKGDLGSQALVRCLKHAIERKNLESERLAALEASNAKSRFLAFMSHEIRTPMNAILGMAEVLSDSKLRDDQQEYVGVLRRASEALLELLNDILDLSKVEAGQIELEHVRFSPGSIVEGVGELVSFSAHKKGLLLAISLDPGLPESAVGDPSRLRQILLNLAGNAVKFTDRGEVLIAARPTCRPEGGAEESCWIEFSVSDTGPGIPEERLEAVFQAFTQVDSSTTRRFGGTGLGLALSSQLVERMGGEISARNQKHQGSRFSVRLPFAEHTPTQERADCAFAGRRVLLADRPGLERSILREQLEHLGCEVFEASDGDAARQALTERMSAFDLHLLACRMPPKGGIEVVESMGGDRAALARTVLLLPADRRGSDLEACRRLGLAGWLSKPVKPSALGEVLERVFSESSAVPEAAPPQAPSIDETLRILLVDDSVDNQSLLQAYLSGTHCDLAVAGNGREALDRVRECTFDLILMDMQMPVMDGYEAAAAIRAHEAETGANRTPILALTADAFAEDRARCLRAGCDDHLAKPLRKAVLLERISALASREKGVEPVVRVEVEADFEDLVPGYLESRNADVDVLLESVGRGDFALVEKRGHNMKGTGAAYGFDEISRIGRDLEAAGKRGEPDSARAAVQRLADYLRRVVVVYSGERADD